MKTIFSITFFFFSLAVNSKSINLLHYNIKELDSSKIKNFINDPNENSQLHFVKKIMSSYQVDLLSLNEVQYDLPNVPNNKFQTTGKNLSQLSHILNLEKFNDAFFEANTGKHAKKKPDGTYETNPGRGISYADPLNFGIFPGQYSTGLLSRFNILDKKSITNLKWKKFNPKIDLSKFKTKDGSPIPDHIELFDKSFNDITLKVAGKVLHVILLHTVPSYHFGNSASPNFERNADQLRFLEWYLTGASEDLKFTSKDINPLPKGSYYVVLGDLNVDLNSNAPGAAVLKRLFKMGSAVPPKTIHTNEASSFSPNVFKLLLDYVFVGPGLKIDKYEVIGIKPNHEGINCQERQVSSCPKNLKAVTYLENGKTCYSCVSVNYFNAKKASDHFPIHAQINFLE